MGARSSRKPVRRVMPIMASGTASAFKLLVATLAFSGAYFGVSAAHGTQGSAAQGAGTHGSTAPVRTVVLSAQAMPVEVSRAPRPGTVTVGISEAGAGCLRTYHAQSVLDPGPSGDPVVYDWRLLRWSPVSRTWKTHQVSGTEGFIGRQRTVGWHPRIIDNPGWYRVELTVSGSGVITGEKFQVSC
ncbi:hypothetical protein [Sphaerisporangium perillae]|uniref:hypothetical protein n=1 Tax=Sphaerisporangium perillae TaxID=2935860 RepID=UPI0020108268|nr:hypothetical protein [Sphaerisporangium perillae]